VESFVFVVLLVCALCAVLAVLTIIQSFTGRQVIRPGSSRRSADRIRRESRWAAGEFVAVTVGLAALLAGNAVVFVTSVAVALVCFLALLIDRRADAQSS